MKKEFKIGMFIGLVVIIVVVVIFAMKKGNSVEERAAVKPIAEPNLIASEVNAPPRLDANSATPLPGSTIAESNSMATHSQPVASSSTMEQTEPIKTQRYYIVRKGDSLSSISQKYYGSSKKTNITKIFEANRGVLKSKDSLKVGMKLTIPE